MKSYSLKDVKGVPLDRKLDDLFGHKREGFFIELGANNGLSQSNTALLARERGWRGILIEPSPSGYSSCLQHRPDATCIQAACVGPEYGSPFIEGDFNGNLMSSVSGKRLGKRPTTRVPARTLENILDGCQPLPPIDFLSLDTEGYELPILRGLNLKKYRPTYMLIEIYNDDYDAIVSLLKEHEYELLENFSNYNVDEKPDWDGTHNDYLFRLSA